MQYIGENNLDQMIVTKAAPASVPAPGVTQNDDIPTADYEAILSAIIHDMRSPLGVLAAIRELLNENIVPGSEQAGYLSYLDNAVGHTHRIIEDASQIRNVLTGAYFIQNSRFEVNEVIKSIVSRREDISYLKDNTIFEDLKPGIEIHTDKNLFEQVFLRILEEAAKYTVTGGTVRITTTTKDNQLKLTVEPKKESFAQRFNPRPPQMELHGRMGHTGYGRSLYTLSLCHTVLGNMGGKLQIQNSSSDFAAVILYPLASV